jgi:hypothetical protein
VIGSRLLCWSAEFALFRVNIMLATPLQNVVIMYHQAGVDVKWRTVSDLMERFSKLGITVLPQSLKYGKRVEGGTEVAHYGSLKKHLETEGRRIGHVRLICLIDVSLSRLAELTKGLMEGGWQYTSMSFAGLSVPLLFSVLCMTICGKFQVE